MNTSPVKALIVDDDPGIRRSLRASLIAHGYAVEEARTGEEALDRVRQRAPDLVLLDVDMPGISGMVACSRLRGVLPQAAIVMITVCDSEDDKVLALESGADDYVTKPFSVRELLARLVAITRRISSASVAGVVLRAGNLELDVNRRALRKAGNAIRLSPIEFDLLSYLMQHADTPIEHARLLRAVWGPEYGSELEYLRTYIKRLRRKIESDALQPEYLKTVPWLGYCFSVSGKAPAMSGAQEIANAAVA